MEEVKDTPVIERSEEEIRKETNQFTKKYKAFIKKLNARNKVKGKGRNRKQSKKRK